MFRDPRMVRRALDGEIERHLHPELAAAFHEAGKIFERPEIGMNSVVAAFPRADGIGAAGIPRACRQRVVFPLAIDAPDRVHRHEVDHVESEVANLRQALDAVIERGAPGRVGALRAWKHFVPSRIRSLWSIDDHFECLVVGADVLARAVLGHHPLQTFVQERRRLFFG